MTVVSREFTFPLFRGALSLCVSVNSCRSVESCESERDDCQCVGDGVVAQPKAVFESESCERFLVACAA